MKFASKTLTASLAALAVANKIVNDGIQHVGV